MAQPWTVGYDPQLTEAERTALQARDGIFSSAFLASHFWTVVLDSRKRRYLRALGHPDRTPCLGQFVLADIDAVADEQTLKNRIIAGDFACSKLT